ncbi:hypothetical protein B7494_g7206 [Chlorociboria aeruginascens]|nr:hypothetical protein B7494_g7206 [Chlorociboria aeruginascens]
MAASPPSPPRKFPTSGCVVLDATEKIEEENVPSYVAEDYYPAYIGEVSRSRYQVVTKEHRYLTLKVLVRTKEHNLVDLHNISPSNVLQKIEDDLVISQIEKGELERPIARKVLRDRTIYIRPMPLSTGPPVLCDLVDIWAIGVMTWVLLEGGHLFFARKNRILDDEQHLAEMVSLSGPPPPEFLKRSGTCSQYWDSQGNWQGSVPIPDQSFEIREQWLRGEDRPLFVRFLRRMLCWMPEERPAAEELALDAFLMQPQATASSGTSTES